MAALEGGAIANPDEKRMVGHYWLRAPELAPTPELRTAIESTLEAIKTFVAKVHKGELPAAGGAKFKEVLVIGIGGSALGPQFVSHALGRLKGGRDRMGVSFFDNTDPDGMDYVLKTLGSRLKQTLVIVISKSGGTAETRNGMLEAQVAFKAAGLDYPKHFVAVTGEGSKLDEVAKKEGWLARFPMWDWVGGRPRSKASRSTRCWRGRRRWTSSPAKKPCTTTPPPFWRSCGTGRPTAKARRTWSCCPTRIACCCFPATCSSS
jgi:glucose-6-phosphate isomerase